MVVKRTVITKYVFGGIVIIKADLIDNPSRGCGAMDMAKRTYPGDRGDRYVGSPDCTNEEPTSHSATVILSSTSY